MSDTGQLPPEAQLFQTLFGFMGHQDSFSRC